MSGDSAPIICICNGSLIAVKGCPAHLFRFAFQQYMRDHPEDFGEDEADSDPSNDEEQR